MTIQELRGLVVSSRTGSFPPKLQIGVDAGFRGARLEATDHHEPTVPCPEAMHSAIASPVAGAWRRGGNPHGAVDPCADCLNAAIASPMAGA